MTSSVKSEKEDASYDTDALRICVEVTSGLDNSFDTNEGSDFVSSEQSVKRPRREEAALFLEKTYELLSRCPPELASWTTNGDSFVVKQPVAFAERVIPTYFKHRNFSSFVRQLNVYGFRKVRSVSAFLESGTEPEGMEDSSPRGWWEFRHERFVRGRRDLLGEIRRRSTSDAKVSVPPGTPVDRVEFDDLRAEVGGLREEILKMQRTNLQLTGLLQTLLQRRSDAENGGDEQEPIRACPDSQGRPKSLPSIAVPSPTASASVTAPQLALLQLRQGHQVIGTPRDVKTPRTPASRPFHLRPLQSLIANVSPSIRSSPSPSPRSNHSYETTPSYSQQQQEQLNRNQRRWYEATPCSQPSPTAAVRSPLKRPRVDSATAVTDPQAGFGTHSTGDVAVRELSRIATKIRTDLLACIIARVTGFLRVYRDQDGPTSEADADSVGEAVGSDIRLNLALLQVSTSADPMLLDVESTCMYYVEILKFISRELPRAVQNAFDSRLLAPEKVKLRTAKDRSLLALFVQKAQKALERQMHTETAAVRRARR